MKSVKSIAVLGLTLGTVILSGCVKNQQVDEKLESYGIVKTKDPVIYKNDGQELLCKNNSDESFKMKIANIRFTPWIGLIIPFTTKTDKEQSIFIENDDVNNYMQYGIISIDNNRVAVYKNEATANSNGEELLYAYNDDKGTHAFKTKDAVIPKLSSFYDCH